MNENNKKIEDAFLKINKKYFALGLKSLDLLILCQIDEYNRNGCECYETNQQFSDDFGASIKTVERSINRLESLKFITRITRIVTDRKQATRKRTMRVNYVELEAAIKMAIPLEKQQSFCTEDSVNLSKSNSQNDVIKEKEKEKKKDKVKQVKKKTLSQVRPYDLEELEDILLENNIEYTEQQIINEYNETQNSNLAREYKWSCDSLKQFVISNKRYVNGISFKELIELYDKDRSDYISLMYGL